MPTKYRIYSSSSDEEDEEKPEMVELPETDADESIIVMPKKNKGARRVIESDDEEAQMNFDRITLSPKTRKSIGIRAPTRFKSESPSESDELLTEEESGNEESEDEESEGEEFYSGKNTPADISDNNIEESFKVGANKSPEKLNDSKLIGNSYGHSASTKLLEASQELLTDDESDGEQTPSESEEIEGAVGGKTPTIDNESDSLSGVDSFADGIVDKLSSTRYSRVNEVDDALKAIQKDFKKLDLSSENDIVVIDSDSSITVEKNVPVSQSFYNQEQQKLENLLETQQKMEDLYNKLGPSLPDRGEQLLIKQKDKQAEIDKLVKYISTLVIDEAKDSTKRSVKERLSEEVSASLELMENVTEIKENSEELKSSTKDERERNQKTTVASKTVAIAKIQDIHKSLNTCPPEDMLMEQPNGLKVPLMDHQRYALTFMTWREKKKPQGGILGDDMGTGKTLTMISLILLDKYREDEEESDDDSPPWRSRDESHLKKGGTLVVCPPTLMQQWCGEVKKKCKARTIEGYQHHGPHRETKARRLSKFDMVITTYPTLTSEFNQQGPLFGVKWHRVVLDEGHIIRNHKTGMAKACFALHAKNRWVLTGTPIQNRLKDLYSVIKFLQYEPFDDVQNWNNLIGDKSCKNSGFKRAQYILKFIMLRRTKQQLQDRGIMKDLPNKVVKTVSVTLNQDENILYRRFMLYSQTLFAQYLQQKNEFKVGDQDFLTKTRALYQKIKSHIYTNEVSNTDIFTLILRLRQICCHPNLLKITQDEDSDVNVSSDTSHTAVNLVDLVDRLDMDQYVGDNAPTVRTKYNKGILLMENASSKVAAVMEEVQNVIDTGDKIIIVSQWTSFLDIVALHLQKNNISFFVLTGKTVIKDRGELVENFNDQSHPVKILLLSLATGGVGLNLVGANHLMLIDPHWNPQLELQAQDRVYRQGQVKPVTITKFITDNTIEARVVQLQNEKINIAETVLDGAKKSKGAGLSMADLRALFDM